MWDSPHEGIAVIELLDKHWKIRFDWAAYSRIEFHYQGKEDLYNPVHLSEILCQGLQAFHFGEITASQIMSLRLPIVVLATKVRLAFDYSMGSHGSLREPVQAVDTVSREVPKQNRISEAYRIALKVGVCPEQFWRLTPFQTSMMIQVWNEKHKDEVKHDLWKAWHTGMFGRTDYKLPKYEKLFPPPKPKAPPNETPRERAKRMKAEMMAAFPPKNLPPKT